MPAPTLGRLDERGCDVEETMGRLAVVQPYEFLQVACARWRLEPEIGKAALWKVGHHLGDAPAICHARKAEAAAGRRREYLSAVADRVLYDRTDYPATILELMSIASLCVHFFSTVAYEAAYAGVPSVCITADGDDLGFPPIWREWFRACQARVGRPRRGARGARVLRRQWGRVGGEGTREGPRADLMYRRPRGSRTATDWCKRPAP